LLKTPAVPLVGSLIERTGGWMVPIHRNYFVSDLVASMKLPVLAVASNRLGCLNH
jgi:dethiobiotin synthetase